MLRRLRLVIIAAFALIGLGAIVIAFLGKPLPNVPESLSITIVSSFGGAIFGTALTMLIEELLGSELRDIWQYLMLQRKFDSVPEHLDAVVGLWHVYYMTKENNQRVWMYAQYTFTKVHNGSSLGGHFAVPDRAGLPRNYEIEAGIRGDSLIAIFHAAKGHESDGVEVVPRITHTHLSHHVGLQMLETWDGEPAISLSLYSRQRLVDDREPGRIADPAQLDDLLKTALRTQGIIDLNAMKVSQTT